MFSDPLETAALGRPFTLGILYDTNKDRIVTDLSLLDKEFIEKQTSRNSQTSSSYEVSVSDSFEDKSSLLDVNGSLKASFLGDLVTVQGSAKYLNDRKKFKNQSRVTFQYKATTTFEQLNLTVDDCKNLPVQDVIERTGATHIVTAVLYGANAFFVFDSEKLESNSVKTTENTMKIAIKKIPKLSSEVKVEMKLNAKEKAVTNNLSCKFFGDLNLDKNPTTFEEAVKTYSKLPELLKENSAPVRVWLTPLNTLDKSAAELKMNISVGLLRKAENALEIIKEMEMRCNEALEDEKIMKSFPQIRKKVTNFQSRCDDYKTILRENMRKKFPLIRQDQEDEKSLEKLFDDQEKSPFSQVNLDKWLNNAEREINVIRSCLGILKNIKVVPNESELDKEVLVDGVDVFCFVFTSVEDDDPYLDQMTNYLSSDVTQTPANVTPPSKDHWFFSDQVLKTMRQKANQFVDAFRRLEKSRKVHFVVAALPNKNYKGATIYHYTGGILETKDFSEPTPDVTAVTDSRNFLWYGHNLSLDPDTASNYFILSEENTEATRGNWQNYPKRPGRFGSYPQVLCKESLKKCHYFEVEWSTGNKNAVGVALAYQSNPRQSYFRVGFGSNKVSWYFGIDNNKTLIAQHNDKKLCFPVPDGGCSRVGVYLDWAGGSLSFYSVSSGTLTHLHTFQTKFTEPLYPGLYVNKQNNHATLCSV